MSSLKVRMAEIIQEQPEDATYEEIMRELAFERMVERGLTDSHTGRVISNEEMARRIPNIVGRNNKRHSRTYGAIRNNFNIHEIIVNIS